MPAKRPLQRVRCLCAVMALGWGAWCTQAMGGRPSDPPGPPAPPTPCESDCAADAEAAFVACEESGENRGTCGRVAQEVLSDCLAQCDPPDDHDPPSCEERCKHAADAMRAECPDPASGECQTGPDGFLANCMSHCDPPELPDHPDPADPPGGPLPCKDRCERVADEMEQGCVDEGRGPEKCADRIEKFLNACNDRCDDVSNPSCEKICVDEFHTVFKPCVDDGGERRECGQLASGGLGLCLRDCRRDDREHPCEADCADEASTAMLECELRDETPEACALVFRNTLRSCLDDCRDPESEPSCEESCAASVDEFHDRCEDDGGGDECDTPADAMLEACLRHCRKPEPPAPPCNVRCENVARAAGAACLAQGGTDAECAEREGMVFTECMNHCAQPPTEPPPCEERCTQAAETVLARCAADGRPPEACMERADNILATCLDHCDKGRGRPLHMDLDTDGDVDLADLMAFQECFSGSGHARRPDCFEADVDNDGDVDLSDFIQIQSELGQSE